MTAAVERKLRNAKRYASRGEVELAAREYRSILADYPENRQALAGLQSLQQNTPAAAGSGAGPTQQQLDQLVALYNQGRLPELLQAGEALARTFPRVALLQNMLGAANARLGRLERAADCFARASGIAPNDADAHNNLGNAQRRLGRFADAATSYGKALRLDPGNARSHFYLGNVQRALGRNDEAVASFRRALEIEPKLVEAHNNLGITLDELGKPELAVSSFRRALELKPDYVEASSNLGVALERLGRLHEALAAFRMAARLQPDHAEAHNNMGHVLDRLKMSGEAAVSCRKAIAIAPDLASAHNNLGNALAHLGQHDDARVSFEKAIRIDPRYAEAHRNLSTLKSYTSGDAQQQQMQALFDQSGLPDRDRMLLSFALGKSWDDIGDYDKAFSFFAEANRLRKSELNYRPESARQRLEQIREMFSGDPIEAPAPVAGVPRPIFIVGMPRSGTTLVEQILASHSQVHGAGELELLDQVVAAVGWEGGPVSGRQLESVRAAYLQGLGKQGFDEPFVTDKMPFNFWWIGFIQESIPGARVIHVKRDARAVCWSNFRHYFSNPGIGFTDDFNDLAGYYKVYAEAMSFWHDRYPGRIYDLSYEQLTEQLETETRGLLEFIGLEWDDACLSFHRSDRAVHTASATQVRRKIYRNSSDKWRHYEGHLASLVDQLDAC